MSIKTDQLANKRYNGEKLSSSVKWLITVIHFLYDVQYEAFNEKLMQLLTYTFCVYLNYDLYDLTHIDVYDWFCTNMMCYKLLLVIYFWSSNKIHTYVVNIHVNAKYIDKFKVY